MFCLFSEAMKVLVFTNFDSIYFISMSFKKEEGEVNVNIVVVYNCTVAGPLPYR